MRVSRGKAVEQADLLEWDERGAGARLTVGWCAVSNQVLDWLERADWVKGIIRWRRQGRDEN